MAVTIKELFSKAANGTLTWEQFESAMKEANANFVDLSGGEYVSKLKHDDEVKTLNDQVTTLNKTIKDRDKDISTIKQQLTDAGTDSTKLAETSKTLADLQTQYKTDTDTYKAQLKKQAYEYAVKDYANNKAFTSKAAKRDFINEMIKKSLTVEDGKIIGADDFATQYSTDNADAFVVEAPKEPEEPTNPTPKFVAPASGGTPEDQSKTGGFNFHFTEINPHTTDK